MAGFPYTDAFELYKNDRMHAVDSGMLDHLARIFQKQLEEADCLDAINDYMGRVTELGYPGLSLPSFGLDLGKKATASQRAALMACLPVALLAAEDAPLRDGMISALQGARFCAHCIP